ncbi:uncharacterized protein LOC142625488 [Castanea sativa]|uniref:uncharacterized protein LOC142625488 n=1 Tax=Castanea sativa TaxID=21020 RepID=UPI003F64B9EA
MVMHSKNEALMCKVFPSSLGSVAIRWFDGLGSGSINSFKELTRAFGSRFITCSRVPRPLDSLLSMAMREGETLKTYTNRYWEMLNEIGGDFDDVGIRTFKVSLPAEHGLRKSLTGKPVSSVRQLMDWIDKYKRVEKDQQLEQLVKEERLQQFLYRPNGQVGHTDLGTQGNTSSRPPLGTINVIFATFGRVDSCPYWDRGYDIRRVMVDQGSGAEIMYPDLYRSLGLKPENLTSYDSPLVGFDGKMVIPMGQVKLPLQTGSEVVEVNFIVVYAYSPYTAIVARPWPHAMGVVSSTLHLKVKYPYGDRVEELIGSQSMARQRAQLPPQEKEELVKFLKGNLDIFAWNTYEAPGVNLSFICHHLNVNPTVVPRKQPPQ